MGHDEEMIYEKIKYLQQLTRTMVKVRELTYTVYTRKFRKEKYAPEEIKQWVNEQRESGKKRTFDGGKFEFDNLELIEQDYKKKKANGGLSSATWM